MKKVYVSWNDVQRQVQELIRQMWRDGWQPDYVVGITRGGLVPANLISQYLGCQMHTLKVTLRDGQEMDCETNAWMSEDAYGYVPQSERTEEMPTSSHISRRKNILLVDDINDSGATLTWIKNDWQSSCLPKDAAWQDVWNNNVRVAVLYENQNSASALDVDYCAETINKIDDPQWIVFPWEEWWRRWNPQEEHR